MTDTVGRVDDVAAALADIEEELAATPDDTGLPRPVVTALHLIRRLGLEAVRRYNRLDIDAHVARYDQPVLFVANHGFGGIFDLNVFATLATFDQLNLDRPVTILTHQVAWTLKVGPLVEALGARPAGEQSVADAFAAGHHVLVMPGGDVEAGKAFADRNKIVFSGRTGFARIAGCHDVPVVPIVTAGAGESLFVLTDGRRLARVTRIDRLLRLKALPVSLSLPWGPSVGAVGLLPYLPLPTKLRTRVLAPMTPRRDEAADVFAGRIETAMQNALDDLTRRRRFLLG